MSLQKIIAEEMNTNRFKIVFQLACVAGGIVWVRD